VRRGVNGLAVASATIVVVSAIAGFFLGRNAIPSVADGMVLVPAAVLALTALASFQIVRALDRSTGGVPTAQRSWNGFQRELDRSRRYDRAFALLRARHANVGGHRRVAEDAARTTAMLSLVLRSIDHIWLSDEAVYVLLAETTREAAMPAIARLRSAMPDVFTLDAVEIAEFPGDGLTTGSLLSSLRPIEGDEANLVRLPKPTQPRRGSKRTG
jgi:hypothetical protein